jgi:hypothetical protein
MTATITFTQPVPNGRILLNLGQHQIGAVFPPVVTDTTERHPWVWRFWLTTTAIDGRSKTEAGAKEALTAKAQDWLAKAGLDG